MCMRFLAHLLCRTLEISVAFGLIAAATSLSDVLP